MFLRTAITIGFLAASCFGATKKPLTPRGGVKTPGVQVAFENLKPEAELPSGGDWVFAADSVFVPNGAGLDRIDPKTNKPEKLAFPLKRPCGSMVSAFTSLWIPDCDAQSLVRFDPKDKKVIATISIAASGAIAATTDSIWLLTAADRLARVDPDQNTIVAEVWIPAHCRSLAFGEGALWLACPDDNRLLRINPATNVVEKRIDVSPAPGAVVTGEGSVWVLSTRDGKVDRIDPKTNKVTKSIETGVTDAVAISVGAGSVWISSAGFPLTRIAPDSDKVVQQFYGTGGGPLQASSTAIWLLDPKQKKLLRIDPKRVAATLPE